MGINKAIIVGRLGQDPEVRRMGNGDPVVNLRVATSESWKDKQSGERREKAEWHRVVIFNEHAAKYAEKYLKKGALVYLEGQIATRKWQDRDGNDKYTTEIVINRFKGELQGLGGKSDGNSSEKTDGSSEYSKGGYRGNEDERGRADDLDDEIAF